MDLQNTRAPESESFPRKRESIVCYRYPTCYSDLPSGDTLCARPRPCLHCPQTTTGSPPARPYTRRMVPGTTSQSTLMAIAAWNSAQTVEQTIPGIWRSLTPTLSKGGLMSRSSPQGMKMRCRLFTPGLWPVASGLRPIASSLQSQHSALFSTQKPGCGTLSGSIQGRQCLRIEGREFAIPQETPAQ